MAESGHSPAERSSRTTVTRHASSIGQWEVAVASAGPVVRHYAREYVGWMEHMKAPLVRRELPTEQAPLIFNFGAPIRLFDLRDPARHTDVGSFITGAYDRTQLVGSAGPSGGVQVNLTLLGIRTLVGRPIADMKNRAVSVEDVFGRSLRSLSDQLAGARTWEARFALMDRVLIARLADRGDIPAGVRCAWHRLMSSGGRAPIASIVQETGWSQKHLIERFHQELGVSPKVLARILRFGRFVRALKAGTAESLADLAVSCGYYDQSHLHRDVREFAETTPGELVVSLLPDRGGFVAS